jgi:hypothetical protein
MEPVGIETVFAPALLRLKVRVCVRTAVSVGPVGTASFMAPEIRAGRLKLLLLDQWVPRNYDIRRDLTRLEPLLLDQWVLRLMTRKALKMAEKHVLFFTKRVLRVGLRWFFNKTAVERRR